MHIHSKKVKDKLGLIRPAKVGMFMSIPAKPAAAFWGDSDGDGIINGVDCEPHNKKKQGPLHEYSDSINAVSNDFMDRRTAALSQQVQDIDTMTERHMARKERYVKDVNTASDAFMDRKITKLKKQYRDLNARY